MSSKWDRERTDPHPSEWRRDPTDDDLGYAAERWDLKRDDDDLADGTVVFVPAQSDPEKHDYIVVRERILIDMTENR